MKYYIFNTEHEAINYDKLATAKHNFVTTQNWANPIKHPTLNKWAIACSPKLILEQEQPIELTSDWFNNVDK